MQPLESSGKPVTQLDLARALGISQYAVSLALRNSPAISESRRQDVHALALRLGYAPNPAASALVHLRTAGPASGQVREALAWLNFWPEKNLLRSWREFDRYWQSAESCAAKFGYRLEEFACASLTLNRLEQQLRARGIQGILLPPHGGLARKLDQFGWEHFSVVRFGESLSTPTLHSVGADAVSNLICAFTAMRERGYRRIGFVGFPAGTRLSLHAFLGSQQLIDAADRLPPFLMTGTESEVPRNEALFATWLTRHRPDAILTEVPHIPGMLARAGLRVPDDIAVAGTTNLDIPHVTAGIDQNADEIGRVAVLVLISLLREHDRGIPPIRRDVVIKGKWVDGPSLPARYGPQNKRARARKVADRQRSISPEAKS